MSGKIKRGGGGHRGYLKKGVEGKGAGITGAANQSVLIYPGGPLAGERRGNQLGKRVFGHSWGNVIATGQGKGEKWGAEEGREHLIQIIQNGLLRKGVDSGKKNPKIGKVKGKDQIGKEDRPGKKYANLIGIMVLVVAVGRLRRIKPEGGGGYRGCQPARIY